MGAWLARGQPAESLYNDQATALFPPQAKWSRLRDWYKTSNLFAAHCKFCNMTSSGSVLVIAATGFIGGFVTESSLESGKTTYVLVRPESASTSPSKAAAVQALKNKGAIVIEVIIL